jgi:hypothetical protein
MVGKNIVEPPPQGGNNPFMGVNGDVSLSEEEWPDIIYAGCVIRVFVCKQDTIQAAHVMGEHLLPEIGAAIYYIQIVFPGNHDRDAKPFVSGVAALADRMSAPDNRNAL